MITLHTVGESETSAIDVEIRHISRILYVCDQSPLHTRSAKKKHMRSISTAHMIGQEKTCAINNSIAHSSFLLNVYDSHLITHASKLWTICDVVRIANVWYFLD